MKINVGSLNKAKVEAVQEIVQENPEIFTNAEVIPMEVPVDLFGHPKSLEQTVDGAIKRARDSFRDCDYSIGLESGLLEVPKTKSGYMDLTVCAIYDGKNFHLGLSSAFEYPNKVMNLIMNKGMDASTAFREGGFTNHEKIGTAEGIIWHLTKGKINRKEYTKQAILTALVFLYNPEWY